MCFTNGSSLPTDFNGFQNTVTRTLEVQTVVGAPVALECDFASSNPAPDVVWHDDLGSIAEVLTNNQIQYLEGGRYLLIRTLTNAQRARSYYCAVTNFLDGDGSHARAPTTYRLNRDIAKGGFILYHGLETQVSRVGETLTFTYAAARRGSTGHFVSYNIDCDSNHFISVVTRNAIILLVTLLEAAKTVSEVTFTCSLSGFGAVQNIIGSIRISSKNFAIDTCITEV